jgi:hypothetical protein
LVMSIAKLRAAQLVTIESRKIKNKAKLRDERKSR